MTNAPTATRSGLMRPSSLGPQLPKLVMLADCANRSDDDTANVTAPTVRMFFAVANVPMVSYPPSFQLSGNGSVEELKDLSVQVSVSGFQYRKLFPLFRNPSLRSLPDA